VLSAVLGSSAALPIASSSAKGSGAAEESSVSSSGSSAATIPLAYDVLPPVRPHTRSQDGIFKPKIITDGRVRYDRIRFANFKATGEPSSL
jgi:hypothetical protein